MEITRLQLLTRNIAAQRAFYLETLGLRLVDETATRMTLEAGSTLLVFEQTDTEDRPTYHFAFNIPAQQFAEAKSWLEQRVPLLGTETDPLDKVFHSESWQSDSIYFYDAAGNVVEFIARHNLPDNATEPFSGRSIRRVDEIGLPASDVIHAIHALRDTLGVELWKSTLNDTFASVGDEYGLFIVVKTGRIWLATGDLAARQFPVTVDIADAKERQVMLPGLPYRIQAARI